MTPSAAPAQEPPVDAPVGWGPRRLSLRSVTPADQPFLRRLYGSFRAEEMAQIPWPHHAKQQFLDSQFAYQTQHFATVFADADFLMIEQGGNAIGRLCLHRTPQTYLIVDIGFLPDHRRRGLGGELLRHIHALARCNGVPGVTLHVSVNNPQAYALYRRIGFEVIENESAYLTMLWTVS